MKTKLALLSVLLWTGSAFAQEVNIGVRRVQGTYNGANQSIVATPGAGKRICVRSFIVTAEDAAADFQFNGRTGSTNTAVIPNIDFAANSGVVAPPDDSCWFIVPENQAWVVTTTNPVDLVGTYKIIPK